MFARLSGTASGMFVWFSNGDAAMNKSDISKVLFHAAFATVGGSVEFNFWLNDLAFVPNC